MRHRRRSCWSGASLIAALLAAPVAAITPSAGTDQPGAARVEDALLSVSVNGGPASEPVALLKGPGGAVYASAPLLKSWRLGLPRPALSRGGIQYYLLNAISGVKLELSEATQTLSITVRPDFLDWTRLAYADVEVGEKLAGGQGAFLNYDISGEVADRDRSVAGAFEAGLFTRMGVGIASFVGRWSRGAAELVRLDTNWTIDDPARMRSLRLGDSISRGGVGGAPLRFGGIQLARNFAVQPGFVTIPLPGLRGRAALPSVVDIYINDALSGSRDLPPGPFEISEIPIVTGNGQVQLVVRDLLGREMLYSQSYYAAPRLLREGLHDYSYEAGLLRDSFGLASNDYGAMMASATHRYGFSDRFTGEVHAEASRDIQLAGGAASFAAAGIGFAEASLAASRSDFGLGTMAGLSLERQSHGLSLGVRAELATANYRSLGLDPGQRPAASTLQAFAAIPTGFGSLGLSYLRRDARGEPDVEYASANTALRLGRLGSLHLAGRKSLRGDRNFAADLFLVVPTGGRSSATAGVSLNDGRASFRTGTQRSLPFGSGLGYQLSASSGAVDRVDGKLSLQTVLGVHDARVTWVDGKSGVRLSTAGGFGFVGGKAFASRPLDQSFASVGVGAYPNVRVYADNQLVGRTGKDGRLIVPRLRPFDRNRLRIELADLPWDAEVTGDELVVRPYGRHGVVVEFEAKAARDGVLRILLADGSPLPAGAIVRVNGHLAEFVVAPGGDVYLTGLEPDNVAVASWSAGSCRFRFAFTPTGEPQPRLGDFRCASRVQ